MNEATMNKLYGWKGRVHKAIKVFEQCKMEYVRVCSLPKSKDALMQTINGTTCNHDADIALTWMLLESSRKVVDATCDGYIASIKRSFYAYKTKQEQVTLTRNTDDDAAAAIPTAVHNDMGDDNDNYIDNTTTPAMTIRIEGIVENTINSHVKFIEQWRNIIDDAQKEVTGWKSEHEQYLDRMCELEDVRDKSDASTRISLQQLDIDDDSDHSYDSDDDDDDDHSYDSDDDGDDDHSYDSEHDDPNDSHYDSVNDHGDDRLKLIGMGMKVDEHADRLFQMGTYVSAGKVLISSLKIASKIESIETAAQEAGTACILGITRFNLRHRDAVQSHFNNETLAIRRRKDEEKACNRSEQTIVEEWSQETDTTKLNAVYSWYKMYHGSLMSVNIEHL